MKMKVICLETINAYTYLYIINVNVFIFCRGLLCNVCKYFNFINTHKYNTNVKKGQDSASASYFTVS
jgi:hypothetical protein